MSHNAYDKALYDLLDATGQMCWDENRDYGAKYMNGAYLVPVTRSEGGVRAQREDVLFAAEADARCVVLCKYDVLASGGETEKSERRDGRGERQSRCIRTRAALGICR